LETIFTPENTASFEIIDEISKNNVAINRKGNKILKNVCDVVVSFPAVISNINSLL